MIGSQTQVANESGICMMQLDCYFKNILVLIQKETTEMQHSQVLPYLYTLSTMSVCNSSLFYKAATKRCLEGQVYCKCHKDH